METNGNRKTITGSEREEMVKKLYSEGFTYREIAKKLRISVRDISKILSGESREDIKNKLNKLEEEMKVLKEEMVQVKKKIEQIGKFEVKKSINEMIDEIFNNIADLLDLAKKQGINPKKIEWDIATDTLNIYPVRLRCPWCGRVSDVEYFIPILN